MRMSVLEKCGRKKSQLAVTGFGGQGRRPWAKECGRPLRLGRALSWQPARNWDPELQYNYRELNSTNNLSEEECRFSPPAFRNTTLQTPCWAHWTSDLQLLWDNYGCCFKLLNLWLLLNHKKQIHFPPVSISPITASSVFELCVC